MYFLATMKVFHDFFLYKSGVYRHTDLSNGAIAGYHSVRIIGWGEDYGYQGVQKYWVSCRSHFSDKLCRW